MQEIVFRKRVSKGSSFNQIYVPKAMDNVVGVGDLVEVRLLERRKELYYSKKQPKLNRFKEAMVSDIFNFINNRVECNSIFVVGSLLFKVYGFNDIDLVMLKDKEIDTAKLEDDLTKEFNQKFHIVVYKKDELEKALSYDPMMASMFSAYMSDRPIDLKYGYSVNEKHILFLLMMPEDLLKIKLDSKTFYDSIRRLITIEHFLDEKSLLITEIDKEIEQLLGKDLYIAIKSNQLINDNEVEIIREIIREKAERIKEWVKTKT